MSPEEDGTRDAVYSEPKHYQLSYSGGAVFHSEGPGGSGEHFNTQTHSWKEMAEFCFVNAQVQSVSYCKQRMKIKLSLSGAGIARW